LKSKFWSVLLSLFIALCLWTYVITVVSPGSDQVYYNIPIHITGEQSLLDKGLMLVSHGDDTVTLHLEGSRSDLQKVDSNNITLEADLSRIDAAGTHELRYTISYPGSLTLSDLPVRVQTPERLTVVVAERISKEIPVRLNFTGKLPDGFHADENTVNTQDSLGNVVPLHTYTVRITGPKETIEKIDHAYITVARDGRTGSIDESFPFVLRDANNKPVDAKLVETNVGEVRLQVKIQRLKTIPLKVTVIAGGGATEATSKITIDPAQITVLGSEALLANLEEWNLGTINLGDITDSGYTKVFAIDLPEGITNLSGQTQASVSIAFPDLMSRDFTIPSGYFQTLNVPQGLELDMLTKQVNVKVRGPRNQVNLLTVEDILVAVDFAGAQAGTSVYNPSITIIAAYPDVGVLSVGQISASLSVPVEEPTPQPQDSDAGFNWPE
jgi:YbbR domain-containing protein